MMRVNSGCARLVNPGGLRT